MKRFFNTKNLLIAIGIIIIIVIVAIIWGKSYASNKADNSNMNIIRETMNH